MRLLDFGIAKLLDEGQAKETRLTELSGRALTPDYASPEQILGEPLTIASDVYSLGVVLYELLTGTRPYKLKRDSRGALEEAILQAEPAPPERRRATRGGARAARRSRHHRAQGAQEEAGRALSDGPRSARRHRALSRRRGRCSHSRTARGIACARFIARNKLAVGAAVPSFAATSDRRRRRGVAGARRAAPRRPARKKCKEFIAAVFREADPTQGKGKVLSARGFAAAGGTPVARTRRCRSRACRLELLAIIGESLFGLQENAESARVVRAGVASAGVRRVSDDAAQRQPASALSQTYEISGQERRGARRARAIVRGADDARATRPARCSCRPSCSSLRWDRLRGLSRRRTGGARSDRGGPRRSARDRPEVATGLQQLSHVYTLTQRRELAVEPARQAFDLLREMHGT